MAAYDAYVSEINWEPEMDEGEDFETAPAPLKITGQIFPRSTK